MYSWITSIFYVGNLRRRSRHLHTRVCVFKGSEQSELIYPSFHGRTKDQVPCSEKRDTLVLLPTHPIVAQRPLSVWSTVRGHWGQLRWRGFANSDPSCPYLMTQISMTVGKGISKDRARRIVTNFIWGIQLFRWTRAVIGHAEILSTL